MITSPRQAAVSLDREQRRAYRALVLAMTCGTIAYQVFAGNFLSLFAHSMGFSPFVIGLLFLVIQAPSVMQIWGARYIDRHSARRFLFVCYAVSPLAVMPLVFAPQVRDALGPAAGAGAFFLGAIAFTFLNAITTAGWMMLLRHNLPQGQIAGLLGRMNRISMFCGLGATLAFSLFLGEAPWLWQFQVIFAAGALVAGLRALRMHRVRDLDLAPHIEPEPLHEDVGAVLADPHFRRILVYTALTFLAGGMIGPFRPLFITALGFSERFAAIMTVPLVLGFYGLGAPVWGALADRYGSRGVYILGGIGVFLAQFFFIAAEGTRHLDALFIALAICGNAFCWGGFDAANTRRLYTMNPSRPHALYMVLYNLTLSLSLSVGSFVGGSLLKALHPYTEGAAGRYALGLDYRILFLVACAIHVVGIGYSRRMPRQREMSTTRLVVYLRLRTQRWLLDGPPGDILRRLWPDEDEEDRLE